MVSLRSPWLFAFATMAVLHLYLLTGDVAIWGTITKITLMPLLALWAFGREAPTLLIAALVFSTVGDFAMDFESFFLVGMAGFALAHVCYISLFVRHGALGALRRRPWIALIYAVAAFVFVLYIWNEPPIHDLRIPIPVYAALLATTGATAMSLDRRAGIGATLFLFSDALIALNVADLPQPEPAALWVMALYIVGQFLLAAGILTREAESKGGTATDGRWSHGEEDVSPEVARTEAAQAEYEAGPLTERPPP